MTIKNPFKGIIPPVSTIFTPDMELDEKGMESLVNDLIKRGVHGLFFLGTGGEFSQLTFEQRKRVAEFAVEKVKGRVPVLIGTGSTSTNEVIKLNAHAKKIGADGVVVINPYYLSMSENHLFNHYSKIAESTDLPILLYNFPALTGQNMSPEFILKLADKYENIVGIKETIDSATHIREVIMLVKSKHPEFRVLAGYEDLLFHNLLLGGDGSITASVNFAPELSLGLYQAVNNGQYQIAVELNKKLAVLSEIYKLDTPFINAIKEAISLCGIDISLDVLSPVGKLEEDKKEKLIEILHRAGLLK